MLKWYAMVDRNAAEDIATFYTIGPSCGRRILSPFATRNSDPCTDCESVRVDAWIGLKKSDY
ncbi:hypothetical protein N8509_01880 [Akkermansiaceae bacterium]|nr:hypothetical protein [Akkermansiaceae bacterium]